MVQFLASHLIWRVEQVCYLAILARVTWLNDLMNYESSCIPESQTMVYTRPVKLLGLEKALLQSSLRSKTLNSRQLPASPLSKLWEFFQSSTARSVTCIYKLQEQISRKEKSSLLFSFFHSRKFQFQRIFYLFSFLRNVLITTCSNSPSALAIYIFSTLMAETTQKKKQKKRKKTTHHSFSLYSVSAS